MSGQASKLERRDGKGAAYEPIDYVVRLYWPLTFRAPAQHPDCRFPFIQSRVVFIGDRRGGGAMNMDTVFCNHVLACSLIPACLHASVYAFAGLAIYSRNRFPVPALHVPTEGECVLRRG